MKRFIVMAMALGLSLIILDLNSSYAQEESFVFKCNKEEIPKLIITRSGRVEAEPDKAILNIRIFIEETKAEKAFEKNKEKINLVIETLKQEGVEKKDIKTTEFNVTPLYEGKPLFSRVHRPTSYVVKQALRVNLYNLESIGKILNELSEIESLNIYGLEFTSTKIEELKREALKKAAQAARETALDLVTAAGGKLGKVLRIEESFSEIPRPRQILEEAEYGLLKSEKAFDTSQAQIESGTLEIKTFCTITYEVEK